MTPKGNPDYTSIITQLTERTGQVVFAFDLHTNQFLYLNPSFETMWNRAREGFLSNPSLLLDTLHPEEKDYVQESFKEFLAGTPKKDLEFRLLWPDKTERWVCLSPSVIPGKANERIIAGFVDDITLTKQHKDNLQKFAAKKDAVLEILSHDLAGPLNTIQGLTALLSKQIKSYKDQTLHKLINMIEQTSSRSIQLIREFVKQEFLESSSVELVKTRVDLVSKVQEVVDQYQLSEMNIAKEFKLETSKAKIYVPLDEYKFIQVINNLISNAIKFTPDGGVITLTIKEKKDSVRLSIADNGVGIPEHVQEGLFEKFTKARRPGLKGEPSVGLGMSIIKTIVEWHQGKIYFESKENQGTTFFIELPKE